MVKVLEVFIGEGVWISGDMHSGTNNVKIKIHKYFSLTLNIVTKKSKKSGPGVIFADSTRKRIFRQNRDLGKGRESQARGNRDLGKGRDRLPQGSSVGGAGREILRIN